MLLFIDNYDSFTYNLVAYCQELGADTKVVYNDAISIAEVKKIKPNQILISPGPGNTKDSGITMQIIANFYQSIPILGVCLGHQCIAEYFGAQVVQAARLMHGKTSKITHNAKGIFKNIPNNFIANRYHSLIVSPTNFSPDLEITAFTHNENEKVSDEQTIEIMALQHKTYPVFGVQFHPESVLSEHGHALLNNFISSYS